MMGFCLVAEGLNVKGYMMEGGVKLGAVGPISHHQRVVKGVAEPLATRNHGKRESKMVK